VVEFCQAMDDDFNTPQALSVLFELAKQLNVSKQAGDQQSASSLAFTLVSLGGLLGLLQQAPEKFLQGNENDEEVELIESLILQRNQARAEKNWALADEARDKLTAMNIILEDSANGTTWRRR
jgi:cysteinyl-tRNA synthetase